MATDTPPPQPPAENAAPPGRKADVRYFVRLGIQAGVLLAVGVGLIVLLGVAQRVGWLTSGDVAIPAEAADNGVYTCPMHPHIRQGSPGRCPICAMALEPATQVSTRKANGDDDEWSIRIEPAARRLANIRTAEVERRTVTKTLRSIGRLAIDESRQAKIPAYVAGRIERLFADYTGVEVQRGDHLAVIYSPSLYAAQVEYLEAGRTVDELGDGALNSVRRAQQRLLSGARQKLVELGMTDEQLDALDDSGEPKARLTLYAPLGGTVIEKPVVEGMYVEVGDPIYRIANLSTLWLLLQLFPEDASLMRFGQRVHVEVQSLPGRTFEGRVAFVSPVVDPQTRTVDVRVELLNERRLLRPGDYARAETRIPLGGDLGVYDADLAGRWISPMHPQIIRDEPGTCPICGMELVPAERFGFAEEPVPQAEVLVVPRSAVLRTGDTSLIYVEVEEGRFEIRPVELGRVLQDEAVIVQGVEEGERVAVRGNFLIDSQMQIAGQPSLIDPTRATTKKPQRPEPLDLEATPEAFAGDLGERLEQLYRAYAALVEPLAEDRLPEDQQVAEVEQLAQWLATAEGLPEALREHAERIADQVAHLHHLSLAKARERFRPLSRHVLHLAAAARGVDAEEALIHFHCNMVPDGGADWLQIEPPTANPFMGGKMPRCATHRADLPRAQVAMDSPGDRHEQDSSDPVDESGDPSEANNRRISNDSQGD